MTKTERRHRKQIKLELINAGICPPPKKRLNRKKYVDQAWDDYHAEPLRDSTYLLMAISWLCTHRDRNTGQVSLEAVGAAKVLKLAVAISDFKSECSARGQTTYKINDMYNKLKPILEE